MGRCWGPAGRGLRVTEGWGQRQVTAAAPSPAVGDRQHTSRRGQGQAPCRKGPGRPAAPGVPAESGEAPGWGQDRGVLPARRLQAGEGARV